MLLDFDTKRSEHGIHLQRMVTHLVTSQDFIDRISQEIKQESENKGPYVFHSPAEKFETWVIAEKEKTQDRKVKIRTLFFGNRI